MDPTQISATPAPTTEPGGRRLSLPGRLLGTLFVPRATFGRIKADPAWLGPLVTVLVVLAAAQALFLSTDVGRQALVAQQVRTLESWGVAVTGEMYENFERTAGFAGYLQPVSVTAFGTLFTLAIAWLLYAVFTIFGDRGASFRQVLAVVTTSGIVLAVQQIFVVPLNYARQSMSNPATLAAFVPMLAEDAFLVRFLGFIDVFIVWWILVVSIGLAVLYRRRTMPIAMGLLAFYAVVATTVAFVGTQRGGGGQ